MVRSCDSGKWQTIGRAIEVGEHPEDAACREAREEAGVDVETTDLLAVAGGPEFRVIYPNGDQTAYVSVVYEGRVVGGDPEFDGDETTGIVWVDEAALTELDLSDFTRHLLKAVGLLS